MRSVARKAKDGIGVRVVRRETSSKGQAITGRNTASPRYHKGGKRWSRSVRLSCGRGP